MATLTRADGVQFVLQSYREQFALKNTATLKNDIRLLAQTNGQFARLYKQSKGHIEAVFSKDSGYLLAEAIWNYFSKPQNLIYCEILNTDVPDPTVLLIAVRNNAVLLDIQLPLSQIERELQALFSENIRYVIKVYGKIKIPNHVSGVETLLKPIFLIVPIHESYKLLPLEEALHHNKISNRPALRWVAGIGVLMLVSWFFWSLKPNVKNTFFQITTHEQLQHDLNQPPMSEQIFSLIQHINDVIVFPGWMLSEIHYQNSRVKLEMHSFGGTTHDLRRWADTTHYHVLLTEKGAEVTQDILLKKLPLSLPLLETQHTLSQVTDRLMNILPHQSISVGDMKKIGGYREIPIAIRVDAVSSDILEMIAKMLADLPLTLQAVSIHVNNGLLSGKIDLTIIGS